MNNADLTQALAQNGAWLVFLNVLLQQLGMPEMGGVGCGVASAISFWFMGLCMLYYLRRDPQYKSLGPLFAPLFRGGSATGPRFDGALVWRILRIGTPGALVSAESRLLKG